MTVSSQTPLILRHQRNRIQARTLRTYYRLPFRQVVNLSISCRHCIEDKPNNQINFVYINSPFFMLPARDRSLLITFDTVIRKSPPRNKALQEQANGKSAPVGSTDRCNTCIKSFSWCFKLMRAALLGQ
jgi:hypothetical protein